MCARQYTRGSLEREVASSPDGRFRLEGLAFGRYRLTIRDDLVDDVELTTARPEVALDLAAPPFTTLTGTVRERETGRPVPGALVAINLRSRADPFARNWPITLYVEASGYEWVGCSIPDLASHAEKLRVPHTLTDAQGQYTLRLGSECGTVVAVAPGSGLFPARRRLERRLRGTASRDFLLHPTDRYRIRGRILLPDGRPLANGKAKVIARRSPDMAREVTTDAEGRYGFLPGIDECSTAWLSGVLHLEVQGFAPMHQHLPLSEDVPPPEIDWRLTPPQTGTLVARVLRRDGKTPFPDGFEVSVMPLRDGVREPCSPGEGVRTGSYYTGECDWGWSRSVFLAVRDGVVRASLNPVRYRFYAYPPPDGTGAGRASGAHLDLARAFLVDAPLSVWESRFDILPGRLTSLRLVEPALASITVRLLTPDGRPLPGVRRCRDPVGRGAAAL